MAVKKQKITQVHSKAKQKNADEKKSLVKKQDKTIVSKTKVKLPIKSRKTSLAIRKTTANPKGVKEVPPSKTKKHNASAEKSVSEVLLPMNMSQRAVEKSIVYKREFDHYFRHSAYQIAYVTGLCFLLVGATLVSSQAMRPDISNLMLGQTISSIENDSLVAVQELPAPVFDLVEEIPVQLDEPYRVLFSVFNAKIVSPWLIAIGKDGLIKVNTDVLQGSKYRSDIPVGNLAPGFYKLKFFVKSLDDKNFVFESNEFHVGPRDLIKESSEVIKETITDSSKESSIAENLSESEEETVAPIQNTVDPAKKAIVLFAPADETLTGTELIAVSAPDIKTPILLYARPIQSINNLYVTRATERFEHWQFVVDSTALVNGKYKFFARSVSEGKIIDSDPVIITVYNPPRQPIPRSTPSTSEGAITPSLESSQTGTPTREFSDDKYQASAEFPYSNKDVERETQTLFDDNTVDFDTLLIRYAVARQSGDEILIAAAKKALQEKREAMVLNTLKDERLRNISDELDKNIQLRINDLQERVDTFEQIRNDRSGGETSIDTDKDGISDYDEKNLYGTNPELADTDNDGYSDGVEIIRGFDPLDSSVEAVIQFESPRDSLGLVREDSLKIETVSPVISIGSTEDISPTKTEIRGLALPDSFVTLYIFSTPTVVTIKTDADGSFVYTFDKELEDGQHEVYVAVTDNAGKIIAQSNPFSFIKKAEAFTPVDAAESEVISTDTLTYSSGGAYNTVVGIGILALGIVLLMLGISLRSKNEETDTMTGGEDSNDDNPDLRKGKDVPPPIIEHIDAS